MSIQFGMIAGGCVAMIVVASLIAWIIGKLTKEPYTLRMYVALPIAAIIGAVVYMYGDGRDGALLVGAATYSISAAIVAALVFFFADKEG